MNLLLANSNNKNLGERKIFFLLKLDPAVQKYTRAIGKNRPTLHSPDKYGDDDTFTASALQDLRRGAYLGTRGGGAEGVKVIGVTLIYVSITAILKMDYKIIPIYIGYILGY